MLSKHLALSHKDRKLFALVLSIILITSIATGLIAYNIGVKAQSTNPTMQTITSGPYAGAPTITMFVDSGIYYAKDSHGALLTSVTSTNFTYTIQHAIYIIDPTLGGELHLTQGTYTITSGDRVYVWGINNFRISGEGAGTVITQGNAVNVVHFFQVHNCFNFQLTNIKIDGNKAQQTGGTSAIAIGGTSSNCRVENCYFNNMHNFAVQVYDTSTYNWIVNNQISNCLNIAIAVYYDSVTSGFNTITGNHIYYTSFGVGLQRADHNSISDNQIQNDINADYNEGINLDGSSYNTITHNQITGTGDVGISIHGGTPATGSSWFNTISGNTISFCAFHGIHLVASGSGTMMYNTITDNKVFNNNQNTTKNVGIVQAGGIYLQGANVQHNTVTNNECVDTEGGSAKQQWGIYEDGADNNTYIGNTAIANTLGQIHTVANSKVNLCWNGSSWIS
jgi:parallel beta-helix repeat protein